MGKIVGLNGQVLNPDPVRIQPVVNMDTPEGQFEIPVVLLASMQYDGLVQQLKDELVIILEELIPRTNAILNLDDSQPEDPNQLALSIETV